MEPNIFLKKRSLLSPHIPKFSTRTLNRKFNLQIPTLNRDASVHNRDKGTPILTVYVFPSISPLPISSHTTQKSEILSWVVCLAVSSLAEWLDVPIYLSLWAEFALSFVRSSYLHFLVVLSTLELASSVVRPSRSVGRFLRLRTTSFKNSSTLLQFSIISLLFWWHVGLWHRWPSRLPFRNGVFLRSLLWCTVWSLLGVCCATVEFLPLNRCLLSLSIVPKIKICWSFLTYNYVSLAGWFMHIHHSNSHHNIYTFLGFKSVSNSVWCGLVCCFLFVLSGIEMEKEKQNLLKSKLLSGGPLGFTREVLNLSPSKDLNLPPLGGKKQSTKPKQTSNPKKIPTIFLVGESKGLNKIKFESFFTKLFKEISIISTMNSCVCSYSSPIILVRSKSCLHINCAYFKFTWAGSCLKDNWNLSILVNRKGDLNLIHPKFVYLYSSCENIYPGDVGIYPHSIPMQDTRNEIKGFDFKAILKCKTKQRRCWILLLVGMSTSSFRSFLKPSLNRKFKFHQCWNYFLSIHVCKN